MTIEIRKHYPVNPIVEAVDHKFDYVPETVVVPITERKNAPVKITSQAVENATELAVAVLNIITPVVEGKNQIAYNHLFTELAIGIKMAALKACSNNYSKAGRMLGLKRTTFRESLKNCGLISAKKNPNKPGKSSKPKRTLK